MTKLQHAWLATAFLFALPVLMGWDGSTHENARKDEPELPEIQASAEHKLEVTERTDGRNGFKITPQNPDGKKAWSLQIICTGIPLTPDTREDPKIVEIINTGNKACTNHPSSEYTPS